ncbi:uncharacterized protein LOC132044033 [Lycium ferocissimum]|uniref:uncharacterized protein LOC132044033 n=1 Tax=Lycium ferocissimum TaxID=112874 RepID=UPI002815405F|nr:uncharacterized protein LOC132044033 [Lycium ferocissimum]
MAEVKPKFVKEEVTKLLKIGSIREVKYPDLLANVVVVPNKGNKFRMCVDYKDLNKACLKDSFHLPNIDRMIDVMAGHAILSFPDAYSGYNQIWMNPEDQEKTSFITKYGTYCYNVVPFRLKNADATYQRLVNRMFKKQSIRTLKLTNNEAEYEAMIAALELARSLGSEIIEEKCDSLLVVNQVNGGFDVKDDRMQKYLEKIQRLGLEKYPLGEAENLIWLPSFLCPGGIGRLNPVGYAMAVGVEAIASNIPSNSSYSRGGEEVIPAALAEDRSSSTKMGLSGTVVPDGPRSGKMEGCSSTPSAV